MVDAYRKADSYSDDARVVQRNPAVGQTPELGADLSVKFRRPARLRLEADRLILAHDGETLRARIVDPATKNFDGQFVERPTSGAISPEELNVEFDINGLGTRAIQLDLLLSGERLMKRLKQGQRLELLPIKTFDGKECRRVAVVSESGRLVFWIDRDAYLLRRLEYPTITSPDEGGAPGRESGISLTAEFRGAKFNAKLDDRQFVLTPGAGAKIVRHFMAPPPAPSSSVLGQRTGVPALLDLDGKALPAGSIDKRVAVLVWFDENPFSQQGLARFDAVFQAYKDRPEIAFRAVAVQPESVDGNYIRQMLAHWNVHVPAARDVKAVGRDVFQIAAAPTLVVIDRQGTVQAVQEGADPAIYQDLPQLIDRLLAGEDPAARMMAAYRQELAAYRAHLASAGRQGATAVVKLPEAAAAKSSQPERLTLTPAWTCTDLDEPGNILVVSENNAPPRILVNDGWRSVAELDERGRIVKRHALPVPEVAAISFLRTAVDGQGKRYFAGTSMLGRQVFLFDRDWELLCSYPDKQQRHDGISDVQLLDLGGDGMPQLCVGFWGVVGVHGVSLDGRRQWSNRLSSSVLSLAGSVSDAADSRQLLVTGERGTIQTLNRFGRQLKEIELPNRAIHQLAAARFAPAATTSYCGLSYAPSGNRIAVGLNGEWEEQWSYNLPAGTYRHQVQPITAAPLLANSPGQWLLAGPDGSIHIISHDGEFWDSFRCGEHLSGLTGARVGDQSMLLISTESGVKAWQVGVKSSGGER